MYVSCTFLSAGKIYKKVTLSFSKHDLTRFLPFLFKIENVLHYNNNVRVSVVGFTSFLSFFYIP